MHPALIVVLSIVGAFLLWWQVVARVIRKLHPFPIPWWTVRFIDNPVRRGVLSPARTLEQAGVGRGMSVLEVGPGSGFLTVDASRRLGPDGRLRCLDIDRRLIARLSTRASRAGLENIDLVVGDGQCLPFRDGCFDLAYLVAVLGEMPDKSRALRELYRVLAPGGTLSISELLPDPDYSLRRTTAALATGAGFGPGWRHGNVFAYVAAFRKGGSAARQSGCWARGCAA